MVVHWDSQLLTEGLGEHMAMRLNQELLQWAYYDPLCAVCSPLWW